MPEFLKPEQALRKATDLLKIKADEEEKNPEEAKNFKREQQALKILSEVIKNRKFRQWNPKFHPDIFKQYIELCVKLQKSYAAKEGLYSCKTMAQHQHPEELNNVIRYYMKLAKERIISAKKESKESLDSLKEVNDLDEYVTPETLLSAVTSAEDTDRADRQHLTPWVRFLWDCFRQCLDILRNNRNYEELYQHVAENACKFCVEYERNNEFRKLCDTLRQHLKMITDPSQHKVTGSRAQTQIILVSNKIEKNHQKSQEIQTLLRIKQLETAISLKLWQEAFKAIEDVYAIQQFTRRSVKAFAHQSRFKSEFLLHISRVLREAGQPLFHAASCHKIFQINQTMNKNITAKELSKLASRTVIATLAIPLNEKQHGLGRMLDMGNQALEKHQRLANILAYDGIPNRDQLVQDIQWRHVIRYVPDPLKNLFKNLEIEFNPLRLADRVEKCLNFMKSEENENRDILFPYLDQIHHVTASRVIKQISETYETIDFQRLLSLVPFYDKFELEQHILDAARCGDLRVKIDHAQQSVIFGSVFDPAPLCVQVSNDTGLGRIQGQQEKDWLNQHLNSVLTALTKASVMLRTEEDRQLQVENFQNAVKHFQKNDEKVVNMFSRRKNEIEVTKEEKEKQESERLKKKRHDKEKERLRREEDEAARIEKEKADREERYKVEKEESDKINYVTDKLNELKKDDKMLAWCEFLEPDDFMNMNENEVIDKQIEGARAMKIQMKKALSKAEEDCDFFERAMRQKATEVRKLSLSRRIKEENEHRQKSYNDMIERAAKQHASDLEFQAKFKHMNDFIGEFTLDISATAKEQYQYQYNQYSEMRKQAVQEKRQQFKEEFLEGERLCFEQQQEKARKVLVAYEKEESARKAREEMERHKKLEEEARLASIQKAKERAAELEKQERLAEEQRKNEENDWTEVSKPQERAPPQKSGMSFSERMAQKQAEGRWGGPTRGGSSRDTGPRDFPSRDAPRDFGRNDDRFDRNAPPRDFGNRGGFSRDDRPRGGFGRDDGPRGGFGRDDGPRGGFGRDDGPRGGFGRDDGPRGGFGRDDGPRGGFGRDDGPRGGFKRDDGPRGGFGRDDGPRGGFGRDDGPRGGFGRDDGPRGGFGRDDGPRGGFGRVDGPRGGFGRDDGPRGGFGRDSGSRAGFGREDGPRGGFSRDEGRRDDFSRNDMRAPPSRDFDNFRRNDNRDDRFAPRRDDNFGRGPRNDGPIRNNNNDDGNWRRSDKVESVAKPKEADSSGDGWTNVN